MEPKPDTATSKPTESPSNPDPKPEAKEEKDGGNNWLQLEVNPQVINKYIHGLGFKTSKHSFMDLFSVDEWAWEMCPAPIKAIIFLRPSSDGEAKFKKEENARIEKDGQALDKELFYMHQYVGNACGTIALCHSLCNIIKSEPELAEDDSFFKEFLADTAGMTWEERGKALQKHKGLKKAHKKAVASEDNSQKGDKSKGANAHIITFTPFNGCLYELDGCKKFPINHGKVDVNHPYGVL